MSYHWIVLADASRARVIEADEVLAPQREVSDLLHPAARLHTSELMSDDRGRSWAGPGGVHSALDAHTDRHEVEAAAFARELGKALTAGLDDGRYQGLVLAAPPRFLGLLRKELPDRVADRVRLQIDHELVGLSLNELGPALQRHLPG